MEVQRYLPKTPDRNTIVDPPEGLTKVHTYNGFNHDENVESLHLAIRRSDPEDAMFRCLESLRANTACSYHVIKELLLAATLEVGPANPSLVVMIDDLMRDTAHVDFDNVVTAAELLCNSPKCRLFAWMYDFYQTCTVEQRHEVPEKALTTSLVFIETYLSDGDFEKVVVEAWKIFNLGCYVDKEMWKRLKTLCSNPANVEYLSKGCACFWIPVLSKAQRCGSQIVCNMVYRLYHVACSRSLHSKISLREDRKVFSIWIHGVWMLCNVDSVEGSYYGEGRLKLLPDAVFKTDAERNTLILQHRKREFLIGSLPCAVNMMTTQGLLEGKDRLHYVSECCVLKGEAMEFAQESQKWLQKC
jgi:hypothetical protein